MRQQRTFATLVVAVLLVVAGCASTGGGGDAALQATDAAAGSGGSGGEEGAADAEVEKTSNDPAAAVQERKLVYTAELTIRVDSFEAARSNLSAATESHGGYVSNTKLHTEEIGNETYTEGTVVLRVPAENYSAFLATVEGEGEVLRMQESVDDVTRQYVDLQARLENLRNERDRLRELYEQANDTQEVLMVEERLSEVQGEIERIQAQLNTLQNQVSFATVTVHVREERPDRPEPERTRWYDTGVVDAFLESVSGVAVTLRALVVGLAYVAPYLLVFGLPAFGVVALLRRFDRDWLPERPFRGGDGEDGEE